MCLNGDDGKWVHVVISNIRNEMPDADIGAFWVDKKDEGGHQADGFRFFGPNKPWKTDCRAE